MVGISDAISDIPAIHPPSIRRACISYREFTGNMHTMEEGKTIHDRMILWMYGDEEYSGRGFEMERYGDWTVLAGMKGLIWME